MEKKTHLGRNAELPVLDLQFLRLSHCRPR